MYCTQCGEQVQQGARFCPHCGTRVVVVPAPEVAPARGDRAAAKPVDTPADGTTQPEPPRPAAQDSQIRPSSQAAGAAQAADASQTADAARAAAAGTTAEFLTAAVASGIKVPSSIDPTKRPGKTAGRTINFDDPEGLRAARVARAFGIALIIAGVLVLASFSVLVVIPRITGIHLVDVDGIVSTLTPAAQPAETGVQAGVDGGESQSARQDAADVATAPDNTRPPSILETPMDVTVSFETVHLEDERFSYPQFSATAVGTAVEVMNASFRKDVEAAAGNAVPVSDPKATGSYRGAYTTRTIGVCRLKDGIASTVGRAYQTNGSGKGWSVVDGSNYDLITGTQLSAAELAGMNDDELESATQKAIGAYIKAHPEIDWWDDEVQTWQENLAEDFETGFVHYFCTDEGVCAAVNELTLAPAQAGMVVVFVTPFDGTKSTLHSGDAVDIDEVVLAKGKLDITAQQVSAALGADETDEADESPSGKTGNADTNVRDSGRATS